MLDYVFALFFMGFPGVQILVLVSSIFLALKRNKLNKRVYGLFFPIVITLCNIWLISIDRTELFDDVLRFYFFLISFCFPMLITAVIYHALRLSSIYSLLRWKMIVISFCYLIGLVFHLLNTMYWNEVFHGHQNVFNALLIGTVVISFLPSIYLFFVQRKVEQVPTS
ncbi:hypothetical protein D8855_03110 [Streptococcus mitis]|jgi:membrane protein|uniref:Uncharacterized protein n=2 Tax=Streptococcus mitis TaxID=28037 RepID=A0A3R9IVG4_STRMT|nr:MULTISPECIES: hypothetical protein [Streptococcus]REK92594.1 hypothetical protein DXN33_07200 [Streptococcus sp. NM]OXT12991.1 hypothetical protein CBI42_08230 [Streptococcus sp. KR]QQQ34638.1 hypothetical protein JJN14_06115 [Streptococcus mitis]RSI84389.1 hypothetical protein D8855_03110 [Streptococcus mitis]RSI88368.1 hypothetical protein D8849_01545 [Streptococcus mitis]